MTSQAHRAYEAKLALKAGRQVPKRLQEAVEDAQLDYNLVSHCRAYQKQSRTCLCLVLSVHADSRASRFGYLAVQQYRNNCGATGC
jgi:hypothetical protein